MAKKIEGPQVLTANLLSDGMVVFLAPGGEWRPSIDAALLARDEASAVELEAMGVDAVSANIVVDPYLIALEINGSGREPVEFRERRRVAGPSVNLEFNSRTNGEAAFAA